MKPYFKIKIPIPKDQFLAKTFTLPKTEYDDNNPYIPVEKDSFGMPLNCSTHNKWIHRFGGTSHTGYVPIHDILSEELVDWFASRNLKIGCIFIFHAAVGTPPGGIHADWGNITGGDMPTFAFNWTIGQRSRHLMKWYMPNNPNLDENGWPVDSEPAELAYPIPTWKKEFVTEIDSVSIDDPMIVRTDIPHNAENYGRESRWCFSLRTNYYPKNWEEVVEKFKDIIKK